MENFTDFLLLLRITLYVEHVSYYTHIPVSKDNDELV